MVNYSVELEQRLLRALERSMENNANNVERESRFRDLREMKRLTKEMLLASESLRAMFWTKEELEELQYVKDFYEYRIQNMIRCTLANLEWYGQEGWKDFKGEGGDSI
ncbi:hypothetical protein [Paenibacillus wynnii]|uniref:hypothetical protein n=1 Tax=Paenibacillus wynnii TaxID=268407 RepID=UPI0027906428|nr:hypothetical protein [Paenibacillus wynnii]MDQ0194837.1 hypothetical protein [Paenibacillus wynnii]